jgi:hypothetical protein
MSNSTCELTLRSSGCLLPASHPSMVRARLCLLDQHEDPPIDRVPHPPVRGLAELACWQRDLTPRSMGLLRFPASATMSARRSDNASSIYSSVASKSCPTTPRTLAPGRLHSARVAAECYPRGKVAAAAAGIVFSVCVGLPALSAPFSCFSASSGPGVRATMALLPSGSTGGVRFRLR